MNVCIFISLQKVGYAIFPCSQQSVPRGRVPEKSYRVHFGLAGKIQPGMMGSMEQYYIATEDGKTEGPYLFESLETFYTHGKITKDTLVCIAGGQEWIQFGTILEQRQTVQLYKKDEGSSIPEDQPEEKPHEELEPLTITVEFLLYVVGVMALIAGVIVFLYHAQNQPGIGLIYLLTGVFSCLGCFWCAKVIKLLSRVVDLLSVIAKRIYNVGGED